MRGWFDLSGWVIDLTPLRVNRQYRLLFTGRLISVFALGMLIVVLSVQTYDLTGSSLQVALVNTVLGLATITGSLAGGVLADRVDRRRVILVSRALAIAGFVGLALNAGLESPSVAALYVFAVWDGVTGAVGATAFGAAVPAVVPRAMLPATGTLMAVCLDLGSAAAPLAGGVLAARGGAQGVYWAVAAVSLVSWLTLLPLRPIRPGQGCAGEADPEPPRPRAAAGSGSPKRRGERLREWGADLAGGVRFARSEPVVAAVLVMGFLQIFFASPHVLIPEFVQGHLHAGPEAVGLMYSATSVGAILATLCSGWVPRVRRVGLVIVGVYVASGLGIALFGLAPSVALAAVAMAAVGAGDVVGEILRFTVLAERTPDRLRGRVQSLWTAQVTVGDSLGGPVLSLGARLIGVGPVIVVGGLVAAVTTAALLITHPALRSLTRDRSGDPADRSRPEPVPEHDPRDRPGSDPATDNPQNPTRRTRSSS